VVVVMGIPGAGKSTAVAPLVADGYARLNRDERGGTLAKLARVLDDALAAGATRVVLDNTYPTRAQRADVHGRGAPATARRCAACGSTPRSSDAQVNAAARAYARPRPAARARRADPGRDSGAAATRRAVPLAAASSSRPATTRASSTIERRGFTPRGHAPVARRR
jgi:hypothetical protein